MDKNFLTGYLKYRDIKDLDTARELDRQHNLGLLKGIAIGIVVIIYTFIITNY